MAIIYIIKVRQRQKDFKLIYDDHHIGNVMNSGVNNACKSEIPINLGTRYAHGKVLDNKSAIKLSKKCLVEMPPISTAAIARR